MFSCAILDGSRNSPYAFSTMARISVIVTLPVRSLLRMAAKSCLRRFFLDGALEPRNEPPRGAPAGHIAASVGGGHLVVVSAAHVGRAFLAAFVGAALGVAPGVGGWSPSRKGRATRVR